MKKLLKVILIFILAIKLADIFAYQVIKYFYQRTRIGQDGGDINKFLADKNPPELVIMGSSTTRFQVNPDSFPVKSCNMARAMVADGYQLGLLSLMISNHRVPKYILLSIWPRNYVTTRSERKQPEDMVFLKYYYDQSGLVRNEINKISYFEKFKYLLFRSYRFNGNVVNVLKDYLLGRIYNSEKYLFKYEKANPEDSINIIKAKQIHDKSNFNHAPVLLDRDQTQYLPAFIDLCLKNKIKLLCYYMPMLSEDSNIVKPGISFADSLLNAQKIPYLKFTEENAYNLFHHPAWWVDGEHMNELGGAVQSHMLAEFFKQYLQ